MGYWYNRSMRALLLALLGLAIQSSIADKPITINLLDSNDLHAHVEPTKIKGEFYGGYDRLAGLVSHIRATEKNVLLLSGGDTFQGTLYFNTYVGLADLSIMNEMHFAAMAVGNHEFDRGPGPLATFIKNAEFPVLSANLNVTKEPLLNSVLSPSAVVMVGGEKIGVVGATTPEVLNISSPGPSVSLYNLHDSVQAAIDRLRKTGINKIFLVTHIGYQEDQDLVKTLHGVSVVVGGHSHSPLGTPNLPGWPKPDGPFPTIVRNADGDSVPILQAYKWGLVLGHITLHFDSKGKLTKWENAKAEVVDSHTPADPLVSSMIAAYYKPIAALANQAVGMANEDIVEGDRADKPMGVVMASSYLMATKSMGVNVSFVNSGGVRAGLNKGTITYGNLITVEPFGNTIMLLDVTGAELLAIIDEGVGNGGEMIPSFGSSYSINPKAQPGQRVADVLIGGKPLDLQKIYKISLPDFTANGGDNHKILASITRNRIATGLIDLDALINYVKKNSPLSAPKVAITVKD